MTVPVESPTALWLRGLLDVCLLAALKAGPLYGYQMTRHLADSGLEVAEGSIYPALGRMERAELVTSFREPSAEGPPRKYYRLSEAGDALLDRRRRQWEGFSHAVTQVLEQGDGR
jgi:PadR family transcriptional regulator PadR